MLILLCLITFLVIIYLFYKNQNFFKIFFDNKKIYLFTFLFFASIFFLINLFKNKLEKNNIYNNTNNNFEKNLNNEDLELNQLYIMQILLCQDLIIQLNNIAADYGIVVANDENNPLFLEIEQKNLEKEYYCETEEYLKTLTYNQLLEILDQKKEQLQIYSKYISPEIIEIEKKKDIKKKK